jgi:hypothetical protein
MISRDFSKTIRDAANAAKRSVHIDSTGKKERRRSFVFDPTDPHLRAQRIEFASITEDPREFGQEHQEVWRRERTEVALRRRQRAQRKLTAAQGNDLEPYDARRLVN